MVIGCGSPRVLSHSVWHMCYIDVHSSVSPYHLPCFSAGTSKAPTTQEDCHFSTCISLVYLFSPFFLGELLVMLQSPTYNISPPLGSLPLPICVLTTLFFPSPRSTQPPVSRLSILLYVCLCGPSSRPGTEQNVHPTFPTPTPLSSFLAQNTTKSEF